VYTVHWSSDAESADDSKSELISSVLSGSNARLNDHQLVSHQLVSYCYAQGASSLIRRNYISLFIVADDNLMTQTTTGSLLIATSSGKHISSGAAITYLLQIALSEPFSTSPDDSMQLSATVTECTYAWRV